MKNFTWYVALITKLIIDLVCGLMLAIVVVFAVGLVYQVFKEYQYYFSMAVIITLIVVFGVCVYMWAIKRLEDDSSYEVIND